MSRTPIPEAELAGGRAPCERCHRLDIPQAAVGSGQTAEAPVER